MAKTKAQLEAEIAELREENEALRDVLAAIGEGQTPLPADGADMHRFYMATANRMSSTAIYAGGAAKYRDEYTVAVLRGKAKTLREEWTRPLHYAPEPEKCRVQADADNSCILPAGHAESHDAGEFTWDVWPEDAIWPSFSTMQAIAGK